jgi:hypothetical protein
MQRSLGVTGTRNFEAQTGKHLLGLSLTAFDPSDTLVCVTA